MVLKKGSKLVEFRGNAFINICHSYSLMLYMQCAINRIDLAMYLPHMIRVARLSMTDGIRTDTDDQTAVVLGDYFQGVIYQ